MAEGPGKYDSWTTLVRSGVHAEGVVVAVVNGIHGSGFSCQGSKEFHQRIPTILRTMADQIENDNQEKETNGN